MQTLTTTCSVTDCEREPRARGLCGMHYQRLCKTGTTDAPKRVPLPSVCTVLGCDSPHDRRGYCTRHYAAWYAHGDPLGKAPPRPVRLCSVDDCDEKHFSGGYCPMHHQRMKARGTTDDPVRLTTMERFVSHLAPPDSRGCRLWTAGTDKDGYGSFTYMQDGQQIKVRAHRWIYEHAVGPIPPRRVIMHTCDTPACCEASHLRVGTVADNNHDRDAKGRHVPPRGRQNPRAVLTEEMVREMRRLHREYKLGARRQARMWDINEGTIRAVLNGPNWKHVI